MIRVAMPCPDDLILHWDEIEPFVSAAVDESNGELTIESVKSKVEAGEIAIATVFSDDTLVAAISFDIVEFDSGLRAINIQCAGGTMMDQWFEEVEAIANCLAKSHNCSKIYIIGRQGWARQMKGLGYKKVHTVIAKEVH